MINVLIEGISHIPSYDLTVKDFARYAQVLPISIRAKLTRNIGPQDIAWCDILVCVRPSNPLSASLAEKAYRRGRKIIVTLDDDLLNHNSDQHHIFDSLMKESLKRVFRISSSFITTSKYLGEKYKEFFGIDYVLLDTVFESKDIRKPIQKGRIIKIVYAAASSHISFFNKLIVPIIDKLYDKYQDKISMTLIGPQINPNDYKLDIECITSMPMMEYQEYMKTHHFDIGIAPLIDIEICRSKYFNKFIEYSKNNIFGIYSNQLPYTAVIVNEVNGLLAEETPESWYINICRAIDDDELRNKGVSTAQQQLVSNYNLNSIVNRLVKSVPYLIDYKAPCYKYAIPYFMYIRFCMYEFLRRLMLAFK